jgi:hypothetical protein
MELLQHVRHRSASKASACLFVLVLHTAYCVAKHAWEQAVEQAVLAASLIAEVREHTTGSCIWSRRVNTWSNLRDAEASTQRKIRAHCCHVCMSFALLLFFLYHGIMRSLVDGRSLFAGITGVTCYLRRTPRSNSVKVMVKQYGMHTVLDTTHGQDMN